MSESKNTADSPESATQTQPSNSWPSATTSLFLILILPVITATLIYQLDSFDPAPLPYHELTRRLTRRAPAHNPRMLRGSERVGFGVLRAPEDVAYHSGSGLIYTGCEDGWLKRVKLNDSENPEFVVESLINTGGRPLGLAFGLHNEVVVADADKGLLNVTSEGEVKLLTDEAEGVKFGITDGVDVAVDGTIYFTDASYKYNLKHFVWDFLEGRPYGRFMSYDSATKQTTVLVRDLYFANGLVVSPDQSHVIFCETPMRRCRKYYVQGEKKGSVETFIDQLPGLPDNIRYDGEGHYWIALSMAPTLAWDLAVRYPFIRKVMGIMEKYTGRPSVEKNGGVLAVDLDGNLISHYYDPGLSLVSSVIKIGNHIFCGSIIHPYMLRLNIQQYPTMAVA
ncbi:hypothetical protein L3X38_039540 [Prunus dulcis]|uniref:Strictosidine synthase conserved region domain-containing protein n=1 Tax=Prunus dulcis TaxID=3755 RepID=A0AAD4V9H0_PRUDU|nr:hypothetical protein L3X38_039540 [Prunus dulcis]